MIEKSTFDDAAAAELHNRVARQIVAQITKEPIAAGGTLSHVLTLFESVMVGVALECLQLGSDAKVLDLVVGRAKERLAQARLKNLQTKGSG